MVGAGPCGAALALLLARSGWAVTLVDAAPPQAPRPYRGEGLMPSGLEALEAMGLWPLPAAVRHRPLRGWAMVVERRSLFAAAEPLAGDRGCWLVNQESLLGQLHAELARHNAARLLEGCPVRALLRSPTGRVGGVVLADGRELGADLVVGCDGRQSLIRLKAGLELQQQEGGEEVLWFRLAGPEVAPLQGWLGGRFLTVVADGVSFALFAEADGEALRLGWLAEAGVRPPEDGAGWRQQWAASLPPAGASMLEQVPVAAISGPQRFPVQVGWAPRWHAPGLLVLGDAAHPMSPVRAQGINMALRDALVAARLLGPLPQGSVAKGLAGRDGTLERIDALLPLIAEQRLPEIQLMQGLQAREAALAASLRQFGGLRWILAQTAPWSGVLARQRWIQQQHRLRRGLPRALALPE